MSKSLQRRASFQAIQFHSGTRQSNTTLISGEMATDRRLLQQPMSLSASAAAALVSAGPGSKQDDHSFNPVGHTVAASRFYTGFRYRLPNRTSLAAAPAAKAKRRLSNPLMGVIVHSSLMSSDRKQFKSKLRRQWQAGIGAAMVAAAAKRYSKEDEEEARLTQERSQTLAAAAALAKPMAARKSTTSTPNALNLSGSDGGGGKRNFTEAVRSALFRSRVMTYDEQVEAVHKQERDAAQRVESERMEQEVRASLQHPPKDTTSLTVLGSALFLREAPMSRLVDMAPTLSERAVLGFTPAIVAEAEATSGLPGGGSEGLSVETFVQTAVRDAMGSMVGELMQQAISGSLSSRPAVSPRARAYGPKGAEQRAAAGPTVNSAPSSGEKANEEPYIEKLKSTLFPALSLALEALLYQAVKQQIAKEVEIGGPVKLPIPQETQQKVVDVEARRKAEREQRKARGETSPEPMGFVAVDSGKRSDGDPSNGAQDPATLSISSTQADTTTVNEEPMFRPVSAFGGAFEEARITTPRRGKGSAKGARVQPLSTVAISGGGGGRKGKKGDHRAGLTPTVDPIDHSDSRNSSPGRGGVDRNDNSMRQQRSFSTRSKSFLSVQYVSSQKLGTPTPVAPLVPDTIVRKESGKRNSSSAFAADATTPRNTRNEQKEALARAAAGFFASRKTFPSSALVSMLSASDLADRSDSTAMSAQQPANLSLSPLSSPLRSPLESARSTQAASTSASNRHPVRITHVHQAASSSKDRHAGHLLQDGHVFKLNSCEVVSFIGGELRRFADAPR